MTHAGPRTPASAAWIAALAGACAAYAVHLATHRGEVLHSLADESLLVPLARRAGDPSLYAGDKWLDVTGTVFSHAYSAALAPLLRVVDDPVTLMRVLGFPFLVLFLAGSFRVVERAAGGACAWAATAVFALLPLACAWAGTEVVPLGPGAALPRDLVFALVPWLWLAHDASRDRSLASKCVVYAALGLLANLHPLTAAHLLLVFGVLDLLAGPLRRTLPQVAACGAVAALLATPYVIQYVNLPRTPGHAPADVMRWRIGGIGSDSPSQWMNRMEPALWFAAAAWLLRRGRQDDVPRPLVVFATAALVLAAAAPVGQALVPGLQLGRLTRVAVWASVAAAAIAGPGALRARDRAALALAAVCAVLAVAGPVAVRAVTGASRGVLEHAARRLEVRLGHGGRDAPAQRFDVPGVGDPSADPARAAAFLDVCRFARTQTAPGDLFLVPPQDFGAFRAYAVRPVVITRKEGGAALSFLGGRGADWFADWSEVGVDTVAGGEALDRLARERGARFTVVDSRSPPPTAGREAFRAGPYTVFRTSVE